MDLQGQVAAITGASSGIGLAIAKAVASARGAVVLGARRADRLQQSVDAIRKSGGKAQAVTMDVTSEEDVERLVAVAHQTFGRLDIMICNAGFGFYGTVEGTSPDVMRRMMDVNFMGTFFGARTALPVFRRQGTGHLVIVSSIVGQRGIAQMSGYTATKAAQVGFAESLRTELVGTDIHVSVVLPVSTETEFRDAMTRDYGHTVRGLGPKQSAETVARAVLNCLYHPTPEVYPYRVSRALTIINAVAPRFADRLVQRYGRRRDP